MPWYSSVPVVCLNDEGPSDPPPPSSRTSHGDMNSLQQRYHHQAWPNAIKDYLSQRLRKDEL